jgi:hypothetical protein
MSQPDQLKIKVPARSASSKVERALKKAARDGAWHILIRDMGMTSAEQTARAYNVPGGQWEFGYTHDSHSDGSGELVSTLWVRWIG